MAILKVSVATNMVGSRISDEIEIDDEDLDGMGEQQIEAFCDEQFQQWVWDRLNCSCELVRK